LLDRGGEVANRGIAIPFLICPNRHEQYGERVRPGPVFAPQAPGLAHGDCPHSPRVNGSRISRWL
jgi:hypothetical protein